MYEYYALGESRRILLWLIATAKLMLMTTYAFSDSESGYIVEHELIYNTHATM